MIGFTQDGTPDPLKASPDLAGSQSLNASSDQANSEQNRSTVPVGFWPRAYWPRCVTKVMGCPDLYFGAL